MAEKRKRLRRKRPTVREIEFLSIQDMAEALGCCTATVYRYVSEGIIKAVRADTPGGRSRWKIPRGFALAFIEGSEGHVPTGRTRRKATPAPNPRQLKLVE